MPSRSSAAKTSPATSAVSSGSAQLHEKSRTTSAPAQPVAFIQRPKTVSAGSELCRLTTATKTAGSDPAGEQQHADPPLGEQLDQLEPVAVHRAGAGRAPTRGGATVAVIGSPPASVCAGTWSRSGPGTRPRAAPPRAPARAALRRRAPAARPARRGPAPDRGRRVPRRPARLPCIATGHDAKPRRLRRHPSGGRRSRR